MAVQIGAKLDAGFDDPLGMLRDCHRRIENFLRVLCLVAENRDGSLSPEERTAVESALEYFHTGGQRHNQDEEESLFPRLQEIVGPAEQETIRSLENEHSEAGELHTTVRRLFSIWIASGSLKEEQQKCLVSATDRLRSLYAEHIQVEENIVFPRAAAALDAQAIAAIGSEFRSRRSALSQR